MIALRHEQDAVTAFLVNALIAISLVVAGRVFTDYLISIGRQCRVTQHRTILIGGGGLPQSSSRFLATTPDTG